MERIIPGNLGIKPECNAVEFLKLFCRVNCLNEYMIFLLAGSSGKLPSDDLGVSLGLL